MHATKVTIGLPVYNQARYLEDAIRSVFAQTHCDWELIIVDDGSSDDSSAIAKKIRDPRVRLFVDGLHCGLGMRLNQIAAAAQGEYLARMDADDLMHPARLQTQLRFLQANPEIDVVGCGVVIPDRRLKPVGTRVYPAQHAAICADPLRNFGLVHATVMGRTGWFREHPYSESDHGCEDWELWFSTRYHSRFSNLSEPLYFYREYDSFSLPKYLAGKWEFTRLLWDRAEAEFGRGRCLRASVTNLVHVAAHMGAAMLGVSDALIGMRSRRIRGKAEHAVEALAAVRHTELPIRAGSPSWRDELQVQRPLARFPEIASQ